MNAGSPARALAETTFAERLRRELVMQVVLGDEMLLDGAERMMRDIVDALKDVLPGRDSLRPEEVPLPSDEPCERIAMGGLRLLDRDLANGSFKP